MMIVGISRGVKEQYLEIIFYFTIKKKTCCRNTLEAAHRSNAVKHPHSKIFMESWRDPELSAGTPP